MATDEEYLDNLLKSLTSGEEPTEDSEEETEEFEEVMNIADSEMKESEDAAVDNLEQQAVEEMTVPDSQQLDGAGEQMTADEGSHEDFQPDMEEMKDVSFLDSLDMELDNIDENPPDEISMDEISMDEISMDENPLDESPLDTQAAESGVGNIDDPELLQMFESLENTDSDLEEINSLLNNANMNEGVDDDMLALLESAEDGQGYEDSEEAFDIFAEGEMEALASSGIGARVGGVQEGESNDEKKKKKKPGFLAKLLALLTKEDDESVGADKEDNAEKSEAVSDENAKLLKELSGGGSKKPEKDKKKASKKDKKKKEKPAAKAKSKPPKVKKKKEKPPVVPEKPVKVLNKKGVAAIVALCATLIASVMILSSFLPQYASKIEAKTAFKNGDYETTYELFYKKRLSKNETELYNKAKTVLRMERRLNSYNNNMAIDRELEAVDALFLGVKCYQNLREADIYNVRQEVDAVYQQICGILESNYGISQEEAVSITKLDNVRYTKKLKAIVGELPELVEADSSQKTTEDSQNEEADSSEKTENSSQESKGDEEAGNSSMEDVLPEEEDITE